MDTAAATHNYGTLRHEKTCRAFPAITSPSSDSQGTSKLCTCGKEGEWDCRAGGKSRHWQAPAHVMVSKRTQAHPAVHGPPVVKGIVRARAGRSVLGVLIDRPQRHTGSARLCPDTQGALPKGGPGRAPAWSPQTASELRQK